MQERVSGLSEDRGGIFLPPLPLKADTAIVYRDTSAAAAMRRLAERSGGLFAGEPYLRGEGVVLCRAFRGEDGSLRIAPPKAVRWRAHHKFYKIVIKSRATGEELWVRPFRGPDALAVWLELLRLDIPNLDPSWCPPTWGDADLVYEFATVEVFNATPGGGTWTVPSGVTSVDYLVVAGGGAGPGTTTNVGAGGGGAGGYRTATGFATTPGNNLTVTVGAGGTTVLDATGNNGNNSVFATITSTGGGGGGVATVANAANGGSGGGGGFGSTKGTGTASQGNDGGDGGNGNSGAGGGGASAVGAQAVASTPGVGGDGLSSSISGSAVTRAGGGGGGATTGGAAGGAGGGGAGSSSAATNGTANTGGGGGGGGSIATGGDGGSGVVVLSYTAPTNPTLLISQSEAITVRRSVVKRSNIVIPESVSLPRTTNKLVAARTIRYNIDSVDSGFTAGDYNVNLTQGQPVSATLNITLAGLQTKTIYAIGPAGDLAGFSGKANYRVDIDVNHNDPAHTATMRLVRTDNIGNFIIQSAVTPAQTWSPNGIYTYTFNSTDLGVFGPTDRLLAIVFVTNNFGTGHDTSVLLGAGTSFVRWGGGLYSNVSLTLDRLKLIKVLTGETITFLRVRSAIRIFTVSQAQAVTLRRNLAKFITATQAQAASLLRAIAKTLLVRTLTFYIDSTTSGLSGGTFNVRMAPPGGLTPATLTVSFTGAQTKTIWAAADPGTMQGVSGVQDYRVTIANTTADGSVTASAAVARTDSAGNILAQSGATATQAMGSISLKTFNLVDIDLGAFGATDRLVVIINSTSTNLHSVTYQLGTGTAAGTMLGGMQQVVSVLRAMTKLISRGNAQSVTLTMQKALNKVLPTATLGQVVTLAKNYGKTFTTTLAQLVTMGRIISPKITIANTGQIIVRVAAKLGLQQVTTGQTVTVRRSSGHLISAATGNAAIAIKGLGKRITATLGQAVTLFRTVPFRKLINISTPGLVTVRRFQTRTLTALTGQAIVLRRRLQKTIWFYLGNTAQSIEQRGRLLVALSPQLVRFAKTQPKRITATAIHNTISLRRSLSHRISVVQAQLVSIRRAIAHRVLLGQGQLALVIRRSGHLIRATQAQAVTLRRALSRRITAVALHNTVTLRRNLVHRILVSQAQLVTLRRSLKHIVELVRQAQAARVLKTVRHRILVSQGNLAKGLKGLARRFVVSSPQVVTFRRIPGRFIRVLSGMLVSLIRGVDHTPVPDPRRTLSLDHERVRYLARED